MMEAKIKMHDWRIKMGCRCRCRKKKKIQRKYAHIKDETQPQKSMQDRWASS